MNIYTRINDRSLNLLIEDLDSIEGRATVCQEELTNSLTEQMNNRMFVLYSVAAILIPLGFITGVLGINIVGVYGGENSHAFGIFIIILIVVVVFKVWLFKKKNGFK